MRYFAYCRKSSDREDKQVLSIEAQKRKVLEYAEKNNLKIVRTFVETKSAYKKGRPLFDEMMTRLEAGEAEGIVTYHMTRLARNSSDGGNIIYMVKDGVIKEIRTPENTFTNKSDDKFMMQIHFAMSQKSSDDTSQFVIRDIESKLLKGEYPGFAPLGYMNVDENGKIAGRQYQPEKQRLLEALGRPLKRVEIDPVEGPRVRRLFEEAARGVYSIRRLCEIGARLGICSRRGRKPAKSTIFKTLTNPFYYGVIRLRGKVYSENIQHEPLISRSLFNRVQTMIDRRGTGGQRSHVFAYTNLIRCGECGCAITAEIQRSHVYYHCTHSAKVCSQKRFVREEDLEEQLKAVLTGLMIPSDFLTFAFDRTREAHGREAKTRDHTRKSLERSYDECKRRLDSLLKMKLSPQNVTGELLSDDEYLAQKRAIKDDMESLNEQINAQKEQGTTWVDDCERFITSTQEYCRRLENGTFEEKRELFMLLCSNITLKDGVVAYDYAEPFATMAKFPLAGQRSLERPERISEKARAELTLQWRG